MYIGECGRKLQTGLWTLLICLLLAAPVQAGGLLMYETGTPGVGLGSAGYAAGAQDASTLYYNPAGMMLLKKSEYMVGAQALIGYIKFQPGPNMTTTGNDGNNPIGWLPGGNFFYVESLNPKTKIGFGAFSNFGAAAPSCSGSPTRYSFDGGIVTGLTFMPAVAYRINDKWSAGLALNATYGIWNMQAAINNSLDSLADGRVEIKDTKWGFGGNVGLMYEVDKKTRIGLTYNSPVRLSFSAMPSYTNLGPGLETILRNRGLYDRQIDMGITIPQQVMLGFSRELNSRWTLMGDVGWQNWSNFYYKQITIDSTTLTSITRERHGQDTWHAALGAKYKASPAWTLSFGVGYDTSAFDDANRPLFSMVGGAWRVGVGAGKLLNPNSTLNLGYEALFSGTLSVDQQGGDLAGRVQGSYTQGIIHFFTLNYQRKF